MASLAAQARWYKQETGNSEMATSDKPEAPSAQNITITHEQSLAMDGSGSMPTHPDEPAVTQNVSCMISPQQSLAMDDSELPAPTSKPGEAPSAQSRGCHLLIVVINCNIVQIQWVNCLQLFTIVLVGYLKQVHLWDDVGQNYCMILWLPVQAVLVWTVLIIALRSQSWKPPFLL